MSEREMKPRMVRRPRHGWFDYEVMDVFGDELGMAGFAVYMVLSRFCYDNFRVTMGLRELASNARTSKDTVQRTLKRMIELGLVVERKGRSLKAASTYYLADVKDLAEEYIRTATRGRFETVTVSVGDSTVLTSDVRSLGTPEQLEMMRSPADGEDPPSPQMTLLEAIAGDEAVRTIDRDCLRVRQLEAEESAGEEIPEYLGENPVEMGPSCPSGETQLSQIDPDSETHLSQKTAKLSHHKDAFNKNKNQEPKPKTESDDEGQKFLAAVSKALRECGLAGMRYTQVLSEAMRAAAARTDESADWNAIAEKMIDARLEYAKYSRHGLLRFGPYGVDRFFLEGIWSDDGLWGIDDAKCQNRRSAMAGSGRNVFGERLREPER